MTKFIDLYDIGRIEDASRAMFLVDSIKNAVVKQSKDNGFGGALALYSIPKSIILAKNQSFEDINSGLAFNEDYQIVKRATGGGAVITSENGTFLASLFLKSEFKDSYLEKLSNNLSVNQSSSHDFFEANEMSRYAGHAQRRLKNSFIQIDGLYNVENDFSNDIHKFIKNRYLFKDAIFNEKGELISFAGSKKALIKEGFQGKEDFSKKFTDRYFEAVSDFDVVNNMSYLHGNGFNHEHIKEAIVSSLPYQLKVRHDLKKSIGKASPGGNLQGKGFCFAYQPSLNLNSFFD